MGGMSLTHILLIAVVLLVFFGPSRLPKAGQSIGEAIRGFKKGLNGDEIDVTEQSKRENLNAAPADSVNQAANQTQKQTDKTRQDS